MKFVRVGGATLTALLVATFSMSQNCVSNLGRSDVNNVLIGREWPAYSCLFH